MTLATDFATIAEKALDGLKPHDGDLLIALHRIQHELGYIPKGVVPAVARHMKLPESHIWGVLTFYQDLRTEPPTETTVAWCLGPSCRAKGSAKLLSIFESVLGIKLGERTPDGRIALEVLQCDGTCRHAPMIRINGKTHGPLTSAGAVRLAREIRDGKEAKP